MEKVFLFQKGKENRFLYKGKQNIPEFFKDQILQIQCYEKVLQGRFKVLLPDYSK